MYLESSPSILKLSPPSTFNDDETPDLCDKSSPTVIAPDSPISLEPITSVAIGTSRKRYPVLVLVITTSSSWINVSFISIISSDWLVSKF